MALAGFVWQFILEKVMKTEPLGWHSPFVPATVRRPWRVFADQVKELADDEERSEKIA